MTRDPLGIITATLLAVITAGITVPVLIAGSWWLLLLIPTAFLAAISATGYAASIPRRHRDERGNPTR